MPKFGLVPVQALMDGRCSSCSRQQRPNNDNQGLNSALITLALAVGQQQNVSQQQQHQPTGVTPGYSYSTVNQSLLPTAPDPQSTRPPGYSYSTVNQALLPTAPALQSTRPYQALLATVGKAAGNSGDTRV